MKSLSEIKILVVEDDPFFQRVLQKRLIAEGYRVLTAGDGREGMKAIVTHEPDLVISDWMMPEVDGLELCQAVKTGLRDAAPYFILLTAKGELSDRLLALQTGADDYLIKPCDQSELMARVRAGLRIVTLTQELRKTVAELTRANAELSSGRTGPESDPTLSVCGFCKKVRAEDGEWDSLESYLRSRGATDLVEGICTDCREGNGQSIAPERASRSGRKRS